jgi:hypothetical protein
VAWDVSISYCGKGKYTLAYETDGTDIYIQVMSWLIIISMLEGDGGQNTSEARQGH